MKKIGDILKAAREQQGLSLEEVSSRTKIHIYKLQAIENGDRQSLPAQVFAIGLIKSYAKELKVNMEDIDKLCVQAFETEGEPIEPVTIPTSEEPVETRPVGWFQISHAVSIGISLLVSLALVGIIFMVSRKMNSYSKEEQLPSSNQDIIDSSIQKTDETTKELNSDQDQKSPPQKENSKEKKDTVQAQENLKETPKTTLKNQKENTTKTQEKNLTDSQDAVEEDSNFAPDAPPTKTIRSDNKLTISAIEPVRIEILWADGFVQVMLLKGLETKTLVFSSPIKVSINNGGAVKVSLNEGEAQIPGPLNQPVEMTYP